MTFFRANAAEFWVEDTGAGERSVVLLHGAAGSSACWVNQIPAFAAAGYRVISYDLRGFGRTRTDAGQEAAGSIAADLEMLADRLALPPFYLVAQAYGGFGALEFAADSPSRLRALVVSTSFGGLSDSEFTAIRSRYVSADLNRLPVEERELGVSYRSANPQGVKRWLEMESGSYKGDGARQALRQPNTLARLSTIRVPTLVIAASEDLYAPPPVMQAFADRIPGAQFEVIEGAGHCAYWEKPHVWNRLVLEFLGKHG